MPEDKIKKKMFNFKGIWWKIPLLIVSLLVVNAIFGHNGLPKCDSSAAKKTLTDAFDQSQFARSLNLSAVEIKDISELSNSTKKQKQCHAKVTMNNARTLSIDFKMTMGDDGNYMLVFQAKK